MNDGYRFIKPKYEGSIIRDPISKTPLSAKGEWKPWIGREGTYWRRRVIEGSCIITDSPKASNLDIKKITPEKVKEEVKFDDSGKLLKKGGK
jgi:hypothetical protein